MKIMDQGTCDKIWRCCFHKLCKFLKKPGGKNENCEDLKAKNLQRPLIELKMCQSAALMSTFHTHFFREIRGLEQKITS